MNVFQICQMARNYVDDPSKVFMTDALLSQFANVAYGEFRQKAPQEMFEQMYQPAALSNAATLDLSGILFGTQAVPVPTQGEAQRITRITSVDPVTLGMWNVLIPVNSYESLMPTMQSTITAFMAGGIRYWLDGRILRFSSRLSLTLQIHFMPDQGVNWLAGNTSTANQYVDNIGQFHDIIALLIARQYYVKQGQANPVAMQQLAVRLSEMQQFFAASRTGRSSRQVQDVGGDWGGSSGGSW